MVFVILKLYLCHTRYLLFCMQNKKYCVSHKYSFRITNLFIYVFVLHMVFVILYTE